MMTTRCGRCKNCLELKKLDLLVKLRILACVNPPFSHADDDVVGVWNKECVRLQNHSVRLPCLEDA